MSAVGDLTVLSNAKTWLNLGQAVTPADGQLALLISAASSFIKNFISKDVLPKTFTEVYNGYGKTLLPLQHLPVISVTSLYLEASNATLIPPSVNGLAGYLLENNQAIRLIGYVFPKAFQNITVTYVAGYSTMNEEQVIPATPYTIDGLTVLGNLWRSDLGVLDAITLLPLTKVASAPVTGEYSVSVAGTYTFAAADTGKAVLISYGMVPRDLEQCVIELVGERYRTRTRIGESSKGLAGETTSYSQKDMNNTIKLILEQYATRQVI